jgi:hypothetical protein
MLRRSQRPTLTCSARPDRRADAAVGAVYVKIYRVRMALSARYGVAMRRFELAGAAVDAEVLG